MSSRDEFERLRGELEEAHKRLEEQAEEIGRLGALAERAEKLEAEGRQLREELDKLRESLADRVADAVKAAVNELVEKHSADQAEWHKERERLQAELEQLRARPSMLAEERPPVPVHSLADGLRTVLDAFAEPPPVEGRQGAAALSGLEVEARGVLLPGEVEGKPPEFLTVDPTQVQAEALSTVRMRFAVIPQLPAEPSG